MLTAQEGMFPWCHAHRVRARYEARTGAHKAAPVSWEGATPCTFKGSPSTFAPVPFVKDATPQVWSLLQNGAAQFIPPAKYVYIGQGNGARGRYPKFLALYRCPACKGRHERRARYSAPDTDPSTPAAFRGAWLVPGAVLMNNGGICEGCLHNLMGFRKIANPYGKSATDPSDGSAWLAEHTVQFTMLRADRTYLGPETETYATLPHDEEEA